MSFFLGLGGLWAEKKNLKNDWFLYTTPTSTRMILVLHYQGQDYLAWPGLTVSGKTLKLKPSQASDLYQARYGILKNLIQNQ